MSKILISADLHIHPHKRSTERMEHCLEALQWIFDVAEERSIANIVIAGDLFHDRQKIDVLTYQRTFEVLSNNLEKIRLPELNLWLLLGNHDLWHCQRWDVSSVNPLRSINGIRVIDRPCTENIISGGEVYEVGFLPYTHDPAADLAKIDKPEGFKLLFGHVAVDGALWNVRSQTRSEVCVEHDGDMVAINESVFNGWDQTFLGHYHAEQKLSYNVEYIGSPLQLDFGEAFQHKHIIEFDIETHEKKYIRNTFSPQHFIIPAADIKKYDLKKNFIRVEVEDMGSSDLIDMRKEIMEYNVGSLEIKPKKVADEKHIVTDAKEILGKKDEMLEKYVDEVKVNNGLGDLEKKLLLNIGEKITQEEDED